MIILKSMIARMKAVFREEGLTSLLKRGFRYLVHRVFSQVIYYLNESPIQELGIDLDDFLPNIPDLTYQFIRTNREADEVANKFKDFRLYLIPVKGWIVAPSLFVFILDKNRHTYAG
ncbi:MAG: hypothetical protein JRF25_13360 [Deltaproteobacteria bacterium]|nr:hypothetical protein [Deltaproteobacteria bacterium]